MDCRHCWTLANPALGDFLSERIIASFLPPKTREATFRWARLCQFAEELADPWLPPRVRDGCADLRPIPDGAEAILALDGSFSQPSYLDGLCAGLRASAAHPPLSGSVH